MQSENAVSNTLGILGQSSLQKDTIKYQEVLKNPNNEIFKKILELQLTNYSIHYKIQFQHHEVLLYDSKEDKIVINIFYLFTDHMKEILQKNQPTAVESFTLDFMQMLERLNKNCVDIFKMILNENYTVELFSEFQNLNENEIKNIVNKIIENYHNRIEELSLKGEL